MLVMPEQGDECQPKEQDWPSNADPTKVSALLLSVDVAATRLSDVFDERIADSFAITLLREVDVSPKVFTHAVQNASICFVSREPRRGELSYRSRIKSTIDL